MRIRPQALLLLTLAAFHAVAQYEPYSSTQDFELVSVSVEGTSAVITVKHKMTSPPPQFEFIQEDACVESDPPRCAGEVVRVDGTGWSSGEEVETTFSVDLKKVTRGPAYIAVHGPNTTIWVKYPQLRPRR